MARTNACTNPSLEVATTGYSVAFVRSGITATSVSRSNTVAAQAGTWYGFVNVTGNGTQDPNSSDFDIACPGTFPVTPGQQYTISSHFRHTTTGAYTNIAVLWKNSSGTTLSTTQGGAGAGNTPTASWGRNSVTATAPANATQAAVQVWVYGITDSSTRSFRFDATLYEQGALGDYFDGDTAGASWSGTAHASTSTLAEAATEVSDRPTGTGSGGGRETLARGVTHPDVPTAAAGSALTDTARTDVLVSDRPTGVLTGGATEQVPAADAPTAAWAAATVEQVRVEAAVTDPGRGGVSAAGLTATASAGPPAVFTADRPTGVAAAGAVPTLLIEVAFVDAPTGVAGDSPAEAIVAAVLLSDRPVGIGAASPAEAAFGAPPGAATTVDVPTGAWGYGPELVYVAVGPVTPTPVQAAPTIPGPPAIRSYWELLVAETRTGVIVAELPFTALTWSLPLNDIGTLSATVPIEQHVTGLGPWDDRDPRWVLRSVMLGEWKFSLCMVFDRQAIAAGPLVTSQPTGAEISFGAAELGALLKRRLIAAPGAVDPVGAGTNLGPASLPEIMRLLFAQAVSPANGPGWDLPLLLPTVDARGEHVRNYLGSDLAPYWDRIHDLIEVEDGPDLRIDPQLSAAGDMLSWQVRIGEPHLGDLTGAHVWDEGAGLKVVGVDRDASGMGMRAYVPGQSAPAPAATESSVDTQAPQDAPKPIGIAEDLTLVDAGYPIMESVYGNHTSVTSEATLDAHAAGYVLADARPVETWTVTVDAMIDPRLGHWQVGDVGLFDIRDQLLIDDGTYPRRIIEASGTAGTDVQLILAPVSAAV